MGAYDIHVQLDAQAGSSGRNDKAVFKNERLFEDRLVKRPLVCFLDQEIRGAGVDLYRGRCDYRASVHVGCDHGVVSFGDGSDLLRFEYTPALTDIHLDNLGCLLFD